jgi:hypothetical protein
MRVLDGGEVLPAELDDLDFEAEGELAAALNEAFIKLQDQAAGVRLRPDLRQSDPARDRAMRTELQACLERIVKASPWAEASGSDVRHLALALSFGRFLLPGRNRRHPVTVLLTTRRGSCSLL